MPRTRKDIVFFVLGGFFLTNAIVAELTGGKLFTVPHFLFSSLLVNEVVLSIGVIPWPVVFLTTDLVNEYFGKEGVRWLTFLAVAMIAYCFVILWFAGLVPAWSGSPVSDQVFSTVFGQSQWIIVGSLVAFAVSQMVDVAVFWIFRHRTGGKHLWLRATGSTVVSQIFDSFIVLYIGFVLPGKMAMSVYWAVAATNYFYKLMVAIAITPLIYLGHNIIDRFLEGDGSGGAEALPASIEPADEAIPPHVPLP